MYFHETPTACFYTILSTFFHPSILHTLPRFALPRSTCCEHSIISHIGWAGLRRKARGEIVVDTSIIICYMMMAPNFIHPPIPAPGRDSVQESGRVGGDSHPHPSDQNLSRWGPPINRPDSGIFKEDNVGPYTPQNRPGQNHLPY